MSTSYGKLRNAHLPLCVHQAKLASHIFIQESCGTFLRILQYKYDRYVNENIFSHPDIIQIYRNVEAFNLSRQPKRRLTFSLENLTQNDTHMSYHTLANHPIPINKPHQQNKPTETTTIFLLASTIPFILHFKQNTSTFTFVIYLHSPPRSEKLFSTPLSVPQSTFLPRNNSC